MLDNIIILQSANAWNDDVVLRAPNIHRGPNPCQVIRIYLYYTVWYLYKDWIYNNLNTGQQKKTQFVHTTRLMIPKREESIRRPQLSKIRYFFIIITILLPRYSKTIHNRFISHSVNYSMKREMNKLGTPQCFVHCINQLLKYKRNAKLAVCDFLFYVHLQRSFIQTRQWTT